MTRSQDSRWKAFLLTIWAVAVFALFAESADRLGLGGRPWFGWWDAIVVGTAQPFTVKVIQPRAGGASAKAGLREGDQIDLRKHGFDTRVRAMWQLYATQPTALKIHRGHTTLHVSVAGSTFWEGSSERRLFHFLQVVPAAFFLACALLIIVRRSGSYEGRALAVFLSSLVIAQMTRPAALVVPDADLNMFLTFSSNVFSFAAALILVRLFSHFGARNAWRNVVEWIAYATNAMTFAGAAAGCVGIWTMWFDPVPYIMGSFWGTLHIVAAISVAFAAVAAVASSAKSEQPRNGWLLLPLPLALAVYSVLDNTVGVQSWAGLWLIIIGASALSFASATLVTYALLKRRVLDVGFVVSRSIVVAILSLIVVSAFVLLEWILGTFLANISHTTGVAANAALALVLGLSMRFIHKRVDNLVDAVMFRKRHENTRVLCEFSKEAAFITQREALLELAIDKLRRHTDARSAALFVRDDGAFHVVSCFDQAPAAVNENDPAVLALQTWHKPLDPHRYDTALKGDFAFPMLARGQLLGLLLCGERVSGEAYAPDEVDALAQFAHGVGSALDGFGTSPSAGEDGLLQAIRELRKTIDRHFPHDQH